MVLLAMGFLGPEKKIVDELKAKLDPRGNLETPQNKYSTSIPSVYAAGGKHLFSVLFDLFSSHFDIFIFFLSSCTTVNQVDQ